MQQTQSTIYRRLGMMMRLQFAETECGSLPARWVDLVAHLRHGESLLEGWPPNATRPTIH